VKGRFFAGKPCQDWANRAVFSNAGDAPAAPSGNGVDTEMNQIRSVTQTGSKLNARSAALAAAMILAVFGGVFVYGIGFAGADVLHNAAHDARHANNFPCH
jgi:cobalt transporter subunit CbtB